MSINKKESSSSNLVEIINSIENLKNMIDEYDNDDIKISLDFIIDNLIELNEQL